MGWLLRHRDDPGQSQRFDAAVARNLAANERASRMADDVAHAASESRKRTEATRDLIRDTIKARGTPSGKQQASDVRQLVDEMLSGMGEDSGGGRC